MTPRSIARFTSVCRLAIGAGFVAIPQLTMPLWVGPAARAPAVRMVARALGARDIVLAVGALAASDDERLRPWLMAGLAADAADLALTVAGRGHLARHGVWLAAPIAAGGVGLGLAGLVGAGRSSGEEGGG